MSRRRHRSNAQQLDLVIHIAALVVAFAVLGGLALASLPRSRS